MNNSEAIQRIDELQEQIRILEKQERQLRSSVPAFDGRKELGGSLFLIGSILLFISLVFHPACLALAIVGILIGGIVLFAAANRDEKRTQATIAETMKQIRKTHDELRSWQNEREAR